MKPPPFEYFVPETIADALDLLGQWDGDARILAGGQSLLPLLNFRMIRPGALIDINGISQLSYLNYFDGTVAIGAGSRHAQVMASGEVKQACPLLNEALSYLGHPAIRNRGTIGGSIAHADPSAELVIVAAALNAELVLSSSFGQRTLRAEEFFVTYLTTALEWNEILTEVRFPALGPRTGWSFQEVNRRHGDFAVAAVAAAVTMDENNRCQNVRVAVGGVGATPVRAHSVEDAITNAEPTEALFAEVVQLVIGEIDPSDDIHASAEYRSGIAAVLTKRALRTAVERAAVSADMRER